MMYTILQPVFFKYNSKMSHKSLLFFLVSLILFSCKNEDKPAGPETPTTPSSIRAISYSVVNTYPHDTSSFTQGLVVYKGKMYEGTGNYGFSKLLQTDIATGKINNAVSLSDKYFGEGIVILHDTLYQLTWQEKTVFAYTVPGLRKIAEYPLSTQGWGITTNGAELIVSDGSSNLYYYDPAGFKLLRTQAITENGNLSYNLNELEYINGFIYANQWQAPYILKIEPGSGSIVGKIDLNDLWGRVKAIDRDADVPNGIAYDEETGKIYITGKKWPELYEVRFGE